ncbi:hypothetical protein [Gordonia sp. N1V]|uniref:hypothetical protein n=1 Tax=Gordonia sp. N1V TaxID=3034163 RepID=UPI0023E27B95|nr:hypothetical protein [Gordonia sp. N1V]MDF3280931.1 hypothetical protein [Gordonia sp. N1V]
MASVIDKAKYGYYGTALVDMLLAAVGYALAGINVLGVKPFAFLQAWADIQVENAENALAQAEAATESAALAQASATNANGVASNAQTVSNNTTYNVSSNRPMWWAIDPTADVSFSWEKLAVAIGGTTPSTTITSTLARIAGVRFMMDGARSTIQFLANYSGTVSTFCVDLYKMDPSTYAWNLIYSSADIHSTLTGTLAMVEVTLGSSVPISAGDVCAVQFRMTGSGSVGLGAVQFPGASSLPGFEPLQIGAFRNPTDSYGAAPSSMPKAYMDTLYTAITVWVGIGVDLGQAGEPRTWYTHFASLTWDNWSLSSTSSNNLTISQTSSGGTVNYGSSTDGWEYALFDYQVATDQWRVQADIGSPTIVQTGICGGMDNTGSGGMMFLVGAGYNQIVTQSGTVKASSSTNYGAGTYALECTVSGGIYTYTARFNGTAILTWTDSSAIITHGPGHRFAQIRMNHGFFTAGASLTNFYWMDI